MNDFHIHNGFSYAKKSEVKKYFQKYEAIVSAKFSKRISRIRCDNGGEYKSESFLSVCSEKGIQVEWTVPYSPEQNGVSKRMNRTLVEKARSMLGGSGIGKEFWGTAVQTAAYLTNRSPSNSIDSGKTPYEMWKGVKPDVRNLRIFGSTVHVHTPKECRKKLDSNSWKGLFVGYSHCGYRIWYPLLKKIVVARDVVFEETQRGTQLKVTSNFITNSPVNILQHISDDENDDDEPNVQVEN